LTVDFDKEQHDAVTLISLLEHLDDPKRALERCYELLNNNRVLLLKTVNYACLNRKIRGGKWAGFRPPDHVGYFSPSNLKKLLQKTGFTRIKIFAPPFADNMYCDAWK
jgi:2-polyprenyl-3-methyl-5-hydroxy-6-metoxy-1,4-benzoquinol methylase